MASHSQDHDGGSGSILPSFEELHNPDARQIVIPTYDAKRLYWTLDGRLETAISVMAEFPYHPDTEREPYARPAAPSPGSGADAQNWHPIAQSPFTEPKVSSVTVHLDQLLRYEDVWWGEHWRHSEPDSYNPAEQLWGPLTDRAPRSYDREPPYLLKCCGEERPRPLEYDLLVKARGEFLTVHDYVSQVHPWLMGMRRDLEGSLNTGLAWNLTAESSLMVFPSFVNYVSVEPTKRWVTKKRTALRPPIPKLENESLLEYSRRWTEQQEALDRQEELAWNNR